ncbi:MAG TPA: hypothetical protein VJ579_00930 [Candidatus Paceibacterota bacterium]|nr:hypothetical protein [Candidatus Paceibacterota bacterium]
MKRIVVRLFTLLFLPRNAFAATSVALPTQVSAFFGRVLVEIVNPLITLGFAVAIVYLAWAVLQYTMGGDKLEKDKLKNSLIYGVVGVAIMATVFGIMKFIAASVGAPSSVITNNV